jgi:hypothetical protein
MLARYGPHGRLDGSFGPADGLVMTDFGGNSDIAVSIAQYRETVVVSGTSMDWTADAVHETRLALARYRLG